MPEMKHVSFHSTQGALEAFNGGVPPDEALHEVDRFNLLMKVRAALSNFCTTCWSKARGLVYRDMGDYQTGPQSLRMWTSISRC